jgi:endonuclease
MTCREAIREVFKTTDEVLTTADVKQRVTVAYPGRWKDGAISADLIGSSVNAPSSRWYPTARKYAFLFSLGNGRYRLWNPEEDGQWIVTETGVQLVEGDTVPPEELDGDEGMSDLTNAEATISLERDMEASLVTGLQQLETGLVLYSKDGVRGQQLDTGVVGRLDLLAAAKDGSLVVIELKVGRADDRAIAQTMRYMGWVQRELAGGKPVRGILIAREFSEGAKFAALALPTITLKEYRSRSRLLPLTPRPHPQHQERDAGRAPLAVPHG